MREPNQVEGEEQRREKSGHTVRQPPSEAAAAAVRTSSRLIFPELERCARGQHERQPSLGGALSSRAAPQTNILGDAAGSCCRAPEAADRTAARSRCSRWTSASLSLPSLLLSSIHHNRFFFQKKEKYIYIYFLNQNATAASRRSPSVNAKRAPQRDQGPRRSSQGKQEAASGRRGGKSSGRRRRWTLAVRLPACRVAVSRVSLCDNEFG